MVNVPRDLIDARPLVDAEVRVRGVVSSAYNGRFEFLRPSIWVKRAEDLIIATPAPSDSFGVPKIPMGSLDGFSATGRSLHLRARGVDGAGGKGRIQWRTQGQKEFPESGQNIVFELPAGTGWQEVKVPVPVEGRSHLVRLHLPGGKALEIQSIRWEAQGEKAVEWEFTKK